MLFYMDYNITQMKAFLYNHFYDQSILLQSIHFSRLIVSLWLHLSKINILHQFQIKRRFYHWNWISCEDKIFLKLCLLNRFVYVESISSEYTPDNVSALCIKAHINITCHSNKTSNFLLFFTTIIFTTIIFFYYLNIETEL